MFKRKDFDRLTAPRTLRAKGGCVGGDEDKGDDGKTELSVLFLTDMPTSDRGVGGVAGPMNGTKASKGLENALVGLPGTFGVLGIEKKLETKVARERGIMLASAVGDEAAVGAEDSLHLTSS